MAIYADYETFSECDLLRAGVWAYARHPSTRILCVSWAVDLSKPRIWWPGDRPPDELVQALSGKLGACRAFNAVFEYAITRYVGSKVGLPCAPIHRWEDTQAIARMCTFPASLAGVARALKLAEQKDTDGARLINFFCKPQRDGSVNLPKDHPEEFKRLCEYCKQDVIVDREVHAALPVQALPPFEQQTWILDTIINERGVRVDVPLAQAASRLADTAKVQACQRLPLITKGVVTSLTQGKRILDWAAGMGHPLANLQKPTVAAALESDELPAPLRTVLELRASNNLTSVAKYKAILGAVCDDNRVRGIHAYHSAGTGRWGGRIVQFQNLPRSAIKLDEQDHGLIKAGDAVALTLLYGEIMPVLRDALRNVVCAAPEHQLLVADKASIEARVLGWLADEEGYNEAFKNGLDLYRVTAALIFGVKYEDVTDDQRWVGKACVLGLGYSMWEDTFWETCKKNGRELSHELTMRAVKGYRNSYPRIPLYWKTVENACKSVLRTRIPKKLAHGISVLMIKSHLTIRLPSGRSLWYPDARLKTVVTKHGRTVEQVVFLNALGKHWIPSSTYGGRLVENIVQAVSRDILANTLQGCEDAGMRPVMHVHDEAVCEAPQKSGFTIEHMHKIFRKPPTWAPGLLLGSSGFVNQFYKKG
jgi:DNA polymerase bacteriophage-type